MIDQPYISPQARLQAFIGPPTKLQVVAAVWREARRRGVDWEGDVCVIRLLRSYPIVSYAEFISAPSCIAGEIETVVLTRALWLHHNNSGVIIKFEWAIMFEGQEIDRIPAWEVSLTAYQHWLQRKSHATH